MKQIAILGLLLAMFVLTGCPVSTRYSVDQGSYEIPGWLPGTWSEVGNPNSVFYLEKDRKYGVIKYAERKKSEQGSEVNSMKEVILSSVGKKVYAFVPDPEDGEVASGYYIYEFRPGNNKEFTLIAVKENSIKHSASPQKLAEFLSQDKDILDMADMRKFVKN